MNSFGQRMTKLAFVFAIFVLNVCIAGHDTEKVEGNKPHREEEARRSGATPKALPELAYGYTSDGAVYQYLLGQVRRKWENDLELGKPKTSLKNDLLKIGCDKLSIPHLMQGMLDPRYIRDFDSGARLAYTILKELLVNKLCGINGTKLIENMLSVLESDVASKIYQINILIDLSEDFLSAQKDSSKKKIEGSDWLYSSLTPPTKQYLFNPYSVRLERSLEKLTNSREKGFDKNVGSVASVFQGEIADWKSKNSGFKSLFNW